MSSFGRYAKSMQEGYFKFLWDEYNKSLEYA